MSKGKTMLTKDKKQGFFKWIITKWHFWLLSVGWGTLSVYEDIISRNFGEAISTLIFWLIFIGIIYLIIFYIIKRINKAISQRVEEEVKFKLKKKE